MRGGLRFAIKNLSGLALLGGLLSPCSAGPAANQIAPSSQSAPVTVTLQDALTRAQANEPQYHAALTEYGVAKEQRIQSRAALLPNVNYDAGFIYTEGNGTHSNTGRYIANNGVHEYISQGNAHQALSLQDVAEYRRASALEALAKAKSEIAARGLVVAVTGAYYGSVVAQRKYSTAQRADRKSVV